MITKKIASITIVIALAAMFFSSSAFVNPLMAKTVHKSNDDSKDKTKDTTKDDSTTSNLTTDSSSSDKTKDTTKGDTTKDDTTTTSTSSSSAERDFKDFQKCLSDAEGTKGFATNQEIKSCYNPIYRTLTTVPATTSDKTVKPIDFSTPVDFSKKSDSSSDSSDQ